MNEKYAFFKNRLAKKLMKIAKILLTFLLLISSKYLVAQYIDIGAKAGVNFNILSGGEATETSQNIGYNFGFYAEIPTPLWELYVQPELFIGVNTLNFKQGIIVENKTSIFPDLRLDGFSPNQTTQLNIMTLDLPLWIGRSYQITRETRASVKESSFIKSRNFYISFQTGPIFSLTLSSNNTMSGDTLLLDTPTERVEERPIVTEEEIPRFLNYWGFSVELDWHHFRFEIRYDIALNGIDNHIRNLPPPFLRDFNRHETYRLDTFRINLGYYLTSYGIRRKKKVYHY